MPSRFYRKTIYSKAGDILEQYGIKGREMANCGENDPYKYCQPTDSSLVVWLDSFFENWEECYVLFFQSWLPSRDLGEHGDFLLTQREDIDKFVRIVKGLGTLNEK